MANIFYRKILRINKVYYWCYVCFVEFKTLKVLEDIGLSYTNIE